MDRGVTVFRLSSASGTSGELGATEGLMVDVVETGVDILYPSGVLARMPDFGFVSFAEGCDLSTTSCGFRSAVALLLAGRTVATFFHSKLPAGGPAHTIHVSICSNLTSTSGACSCSWGCTAGALLGSS